MLPSAFAEAAPDSDRQCQSHLLWSIKRMKSVEVKHMVTARIPTRGAEFYLHLYHNNQDDKEHLALVLGDVRGRSNLLVRLHSECFTGDVLGSWRCDCGEQLQYAMQQIASAGAGVIIYLRQEGRGIGLLDKLRAYNLQDQGYDTIEANLELGHLADERDYTVAVRILENLDIRSVRLLTNNPAKIDQLRELGIEINERIPVEPTILSENANYIFTKVTRMNHMLDLDFPALPFMTAENG
jgi:GTP cyclohydrolase II